MLKKLSESETSRLRTLIQEMATLERDRGYDFNPMWLRTQSWLVVPVEDSGHLAQEEICCVVRALRSEGCVSCFAITAPGLPAEFSNSYELSTSEDDLRAFNEECGLFRVLLTNADLSWAISCNEWFNLFAGPRALVEQLLGDSIDGARQKFIAYAGIVEQGGNEGLVRIARQYR